VKGLGWDDMSRGSPETISELRFYEQLTEALQGYGISYRVTERLDEFYQDTLTGDFDFVTVDLMEQKTLKPVGADAARTVRARMALERRDPDFPVFLLSSTPEFFRVEDAYNNNITPVAKSLDAAILVAQQITFRLKESGRFGRVGQVLIFARHAKESLSGQRSDNHALPQLRKIIKEAGGEVKEVSAENFSLDILDELRRQIQEAGRVIVLLTRDEAIAAAASSTSHLARPNVYLELGMVLGVRGANRKLILLKEEGAYLTSGVGSHQPIPYEGDLNSIRKQLTKALQRHP